jgi:hypothetical protein
VRKLDNARTARVFELRRGALFREWTEFYRDQFHARVLHEVRRKALTVAVGNAKK